MSHIEFDHQANDRAKSIWECQKCLTDATMRFSDIAEVGIPVCAECGDDMELQTVEIQADKSSLGLEINRELVLSTVHISEDCNDALMRASKGNYSEHIDDTLTNLSIYQDEYGFRIFTTFDTENELPETDYPELDVLLAFAKSMGCKWLVLDCDGPTCSKFETFDW